MKPKSLILFAVAAGCGLVAMVAAQQLMAGRGPATPTKRVLVARADVLVGVALTKDLVGFKDLPVDAVPEGAVENEEQFAERSLKTRSYAGQVILQAQLGEKGVFGTSAEIPKGMRLASVPVTSTMIHSGIMKPGDRVDVVLTYSMSRPGVGSQSFTKTILEYIQVFAMGDLKMGVEANDGKGTSKEVKNVSLLLTPLQAEIMALAQNKGTVNLTLRSIEDKEYVSSRGTDEAQLAELRAEFSDTPRNKPEAMPTPVAVPAPIVKQEEPKPSFSEFLQGPIAAEVPAEPVKPTWKIEVFQGDERKIHEVDLPDADGATKATPVVSKAGPPTSLLAPMKQWLTGGVKRPTVQP
ncbi:MAG: Flp pilus assembly protein CpaB [Planctomycetaceae bacterium]|nr:Flp pilus assembly protein CpaB [Planctomycetaceae bacterium]